MSASRSGKRIALVIDTLSGGGAEKVVLTLARALEGHGHSVDVLVLGRRSDYSPPDDLPISFVLAGKKAKLDAPFALGRAVRQLKRKLTELGQRKGPFDLIVSNLDDSHRVLSRCALSNVVYVVHNSIEASLVRARRQGLMSYLRKRRVVSALNGQSIVTVSRGLQQEILEHGRIAPRSVTTIYNPMDLEGIRAQAQEHIAEIPDDPYVLHLGRFSEQKRHDLLFEAMARLETPCRLVLLSNRSDKLREAVRAADLADSTIIPGFQQNPYPWMKHAKVVVLSSDYEGLGMVLIEALACGTPVVSTRCPHGPSEILTERLAEYLVPVGDSAALARAIDKAITDAPKVNGAPILEEVATDRVVHAYLKLVERP